MVFKPSSLAPLQRWCSCFQSIKKGLIINVFFIFSIFGSFMTFCFLKNERGGRVGGLVNGEMGHMFLINGK